jgi:hypothetical protein
MENGAEGRYHRKHKQEATGVVNSQEPQRSEQQNHRDAKVHCQTQGEQTAEQTAALDAALDGCCGHGLGLELDVF